MFIFESALLANFGLSNKKLSRDQYKYDFINYHQRELNWRAFIVIRLMVTAGLIILTENRASKHELKHFKEEGPLKDSMLYLLTLHLGELIFLR